ncbi:MAG: hypothetical protein RTU63_08640 [Candidatus Thorarchaeota archaeon]
MHGRKPISKELALIDMGTETGTINILLIQLAQSKAVVLFLVVLAISYLSRINFVWYWIFEYLIYGSIYFLVFLFAMALQTALHERGHIKKLRELGFEAVDFEVNRIGDVSFRIENMDQMSANEIYQNAASPFLAPTSYVVDSVSLLILLVINFLSPFPLSLVMCVFTILASISLVGSFCAVYTIRMRKTSGLCVKLARTVTSRGDIDEIVAWNKMNQTVD